MRHKSERQPAIFVLNDPTAPRLNPELAKEIGLNESLLFLQLEYWLRQSGTLQADEQYWIYESVTDIQSVFSFWSRATINRIIHSLIEQELVQVSDQWNKKRYDRTRWFTLNRTGIDRLRSVKVSDWWLSQNETGQTQTETDPFQNETGSTQNETGPFQNETRSAQNGTTIPDQSSDQSPETSAESSSESIAPETDDDDPPLLTDLIDLADLQEGAARAILDHYGQTGAGQWLAFVLDKDKDNPAAYLYTCCIRKHDPPPAHYTPADVQRILEQFRRALDDETEPTAEPPTWSLSLNQAPSKLHQLWHACQGELELQMTRATFNTWIKPLTIASLDRDACSATLQAPNKYIADWITNRLAAPLIRTMAGVAELPADRFTFTCTVASGNTSEEMTL